MKLAVVLVAVVAACSAAPQSRKLFHEHFEDFLEVIENEAGADIARLAEAYMVFDEFTQTFEYLRTNNFKELIYEMESLPEFVAVIEFLENDNIDIYFFLDRLNDMLESTRKLKRSSARQQVSGTTFSAFITDSIELFPKAQLAALFEQKKEEDAEFREAMFNLESGEFLETITALRENETFQKEAQSLAENGIELLVLFNEVMAVFGQNY